MSMRFLVHLPKSMGRCSGAEKVPANTQAWKGTLNEKELTLQMKQISRAFRQKTNNNHE